MSIRLRRTEAGLVALCAARSMPKDGDIYLDDEVHGALALKFRLDFSSEGIILPYEPSSQPGVWDSRPQIAAIEREESNNSNRDWWDETYRCT
jgi:hypothetical protein